MTSQANADIENPVQSHGSPPPLLQSAPQLKLELQSQPGSERAAINTKSSVATDHAGPVIERLQGWRLGGTTFSCTLCIFLANLEVAIVSTALVAITDDLKSFGQGSWIISAYLLTYTGFLIIWAKFSDTFGRRQSLCTALVIFEIASGACGGAQSTTQLIVFRSFQGLGGSGLLSLTFVILPEMVEPQKYALYASYTSFAFVLGFLFGPLLGGAIVSNTTWRWVFLINLPIGLLTIILLVSFMPARFPNIKSSERKIHLTRLKEIDYLGALFIFAISAFIVSALEEAGTTYSWSSAPILILLVLAGICALGFLPWERHVDHKRGDQKAVFTWRLMTNRVFVGALLYGLASFYPAVLTADRITLFAGVPFTVAIIQIPQEWQTVSDTTALEAGIRLLPFTLSYSVGQILAMILTSKIKVPPVFVLFLGAGLQIISTAVMAIAHIRTGGGKYACEIVLSIGLGANIGVLVQLTPQLIRGKDQATAMGAITQFRALGGIIGFAIATNAFNGYIRSRLSIQLNPDQLRSVLQSVTTAIDSLPPETQKTVRQTFGSAYDLQMEILIGFAIAQALAVGLMWERKFRILV